MDRRTFLRACGLLYLGTLLGDRVLTAGNTNSDGRKYRRALLTDESGKPLRVEDIMEGKGYIFFYPFRSTPCLLINTGVKIPPGEALLKNGKRYSYGGGVGPNKSIIAFLAICTHQLSFPRKDYSAISYYPEDLKSQLVKRGQVIQCCAHLSAFDPLRGGIPISGPAKDPLPWIKLSVEEEGIYAVDVVGRDLFEEFFDYFRADLRKLYGSTRKAKEPVVKTPVVDLEKYTNEIIRC